MILSLIFFPLFNFLFIFSFARLITRKYLFIPGFLGFFIAVIILIASLPSFLRGETLQLSLGDWISCGMLNAEWRFMIDGTTHVMLLVVFSVSAAVHFYSSEYMAEDPHLPRFVSYLSLFTFFMLILVSATNYVNLFLGWEGVGLCSYLLISFWFTRVQANKAAIKAMIMNRIADSAYVIALGSIFYTYQSLDFSIVFSLSSFFYNDKILFCGLVVRPNSVITILLLLAAMGKSAQLGLHTWLPDAMEGPTPVSALIHAATMVTAGVFLIIRSSYLFETAPVSLLLTTLVGAGTMFFAATAGLVQNDLKKIIAYSTCSQLGYMVFACGLSQYTLSLFHLSNHAFFKALLFLSAGSIIHGLSNEQDLRKMGALLQLFPYTYTMFLIGSLALAGFPFLAGFYSKDIIIESAAATYEVAGSFSYWLSLLTAFFTSFYSFRLIYFAFYGNARSPRAYLLKAHEITNRMFLSLAFLAGNSIFLGYLTKDAFLGIGSQFLVQCTGGVRHTPILDGEFLPFYIKILPFIGFLLALTLAFLVYAVLPANVFFLHMNPRLRRTYYFLTNKWYFDVTFNLVFNQPTLEGAYRVLFGLIDKGLLEVVGPTGAANKVFAVGFLLTKVQTGKVYEYAWFMPFAMYVYVSAMYAFGWY